MRKLAFSIIGIVALASSASANAQTCTITGAVTPEIGQRALIAYIHITDSTGSGKSDVELGSFSAEYVKPTDNAQSFFPSNVVAIPYTGGNYVVRIPMTSPHIADQAIGATVRIRKTQRGGATSGTGLSVEYDCSAFVPKIKA